MGLLCLGSRVRMGLGLLLLLGVCVGLRLLLLLLLLARGLLIGCRLAGVIGVLRLIRSVRTMLARLIVAAGLPIRAICPDAMGARFASLLLIGR